MSTPARRQGWSCPELVPHPRRRIPLFGDIVGVSVATPIQDSMRFAAELGPIFRRKVFDTEIVLVSGADLVEELVDESRFAKHVGLGVANLRMMARDGLFTAYNEEPNWQRAHDILAPGFTKEAMRRYHPTMLAMAQRLVAAWKTSPDTPVRVTDDVTKLTLETIARTGFGYDFGSFDRTERHPFVTAMVNTLSYAEQQNAIPPGVGPVLYRRARRRNAANIRYLGEVVDTVVRARQDSADTSTEDLLGLMLNTAQPGTGHKLSTANIRDQVITFLVAGHETTSGLLSFALYYFAKYPAMQAKARAEVDRVWGNAEPSYEQVSKLRYIRRVLDESLRLWPTAPAFTRQARADTTLGDRHPMRRGARATVLIPMLHRDPAIWGADAESFNPDRFAPEAVRSRPGHAYKPFGTGARACIGRQFALHEAALVIGTLLQHYHFDDHDNYQLKIAERLTLTPAQFTLTAIPRMHDSDPLSQEQVNA